MMKMSGYHLMSGNVHRETETKDDAKLLAKVIYSKTNKPVEIHKKVYKVSYD